MEKFDFRGWATIHNVRCSDGRTITPESFKHCDGKKVPLVWSHQHDDPTNVLGHAYLEYHDEGIRAYGFFNETFKAQETKCSVQHGDIVALSIYANHLKENGPVSSRIVSHGDIQEVSLVIAGANPGAFIDSVLSHADDMEPTPTDAAVIYSGEPLELYHADKEKNEDNEKKDEAETKKEEPSDDKLEDKTTLKDVLDTLNEKQKIAVYGIVAEALESKDESDETKNNISHKEDNTMKNNVFDQNATNTPAGSVISHSDMMAVINDAKRYGSMRESALQHGITEIETLFPFGKDDGRNVTNTPIFIDRNTGWVKKVMASVHHTPYSRIKSLFADITADEARALGYMKGNLKKEEVFTLLKRTTAPTTVYKKQKLERDDVIDIVDFDVLAWIKAEMRGKLDEELARAYLIGDGRLGDSDDKIKEDCIRPIWTDDDKLFTINKLVESDGTEDGRAKAFIKSAIKARKNYKGSGNPTLYTTEDMLTEMLLLTDNMGRDLYEDETKLAKKLRVKEIVTVPVMEGATRNYEGSDRALLGIIVNLNDYNVGADKGGAVNMFDDFDIDYNAQKYLIETRCSGALIMPFSAIVLEEAVVAG